MSYDEIYSKLKNVGQEQLLDFYDELNDEEKENLLKQQFAVTRPNEVWVSDVTYFKYNNTVFYICVILNLFARKVMQLFQVHSASCQ